MKALVTGDWHFGLNVGGYDFTDDLVKAVQYIIDVADQEKVDLFVMLGDLFNDPHPTPRTMAIVMSLIDSLWMPGIFIVGNHDAGKGFHTEIENGLKVQVPNPDALEPLRRVRWKAPIWMPTGPVIGPFENFKVDFACVGHVTDAVAKRCDAGQFTAEQYVDETFDLIARHDGKNEAYLGAVFCHLDVSGAVMGSEEAIMRGGRLPMPVEKAKRLPFPVFNGHIHTAQTIQPNLHLPGSVIGTDFSNVDGRHGFVIAEV